LVMLFLNYLPLCSVEVGDEKRKANPNATRCLGHIITTPSPLCLARCQMEKKRLSRLIILEPRRAQTPFLMGPKSFACVVLFFFCNHLILFARIHPSDPSSSVMPASSLSCRFMLANCIFSATACIKVEKNRSERQCCKPKS